MSEVTCYRHKSCYLCGGARFFELSTGRHYPCPLCGMDGCILVKEGEAPPVPGRLLKTVLREVGPGVNPMQDNKH